MLLLTSTTVHAGAHCDTTSRVIGELYCQAAACRVAWGLAEQVRGGLRWESFAEYLGAEVSKCGSMSLTRFADGSAWHSDGGSGQIMPPGDEDIVIVAGDYRG